MVLGILIIALIATTNFPHAPHFAPKFGIKETSAVLKVPYMAFAAVGYGAMNLSMIASSLTLHRMGCLYQDITLAIQ